MFNSNSNNQHYANPQAYGSNHAYQQQMYPYGQHSSHLSHQSHHSQSPQQHYNLSSSQFGSGGPMMSSNDYMHHPGYVQPSHAGGYGHFSMPSAGMQHLQGQQNLMMPGHMQGVGQNPVNLHGAGVVQPAAGGRGRGKKGQGAAPAEKSTRGRKPKKDGLGATTKTGKAPKVAKGLKGDRVAPYPATKGKKGLDGEKEKKKKKDAPKPVLRSHLKPPKQAPSAWQVYFTEELQKMKAQQPGERLNVAHVAKDAGQRYAALPEEKKKEFQRKSLEAKADWEREMEQWRQTLTPEDIKQENMYRTAQRKAGKSRKGNLKDPNAPKKPLSEQETTKQSVLAASKWRALPENEKQPYLEKAEADKAEYERLRREYEAAHGGKIASASTSKRSRNDVAAMPADHFNAAFDQEHFMGAGSLDDHFGTNPDGTSLKPEDLM